MLEQENNLENNNQSRRSGRLQGKERRKYDPEHNEEEYEVGESNDANLSQRPARARKINYAMPMEEEIDVPEPQIEETRSIFGPEIDQILWRRQEETEQVFLVKYRERSYLHTEWLRENEILKEKNGKQKINRFNKQFEKKLTEEWEFGEDQYFDPAFVEVDRVLSCTEIFPVVHPKKGSEMKGKWGEGLCRVMAHLLNFSRDNIHYGILFKSTPIDFQTINNRLYLGYYRNASEFWTELGGIFAGTQFEEASEMSRIRDTLKEASRVLYDIWYEQQEQEWNQQKLLQLIFSYFSRSRYVNEEEYKNKINDDHRQAILPELKKEKINEMVSRLMDKIDAPINLNWQEISEELNITLEERECSTKEQLEDYIREELWKGIIDIDQEMVNEMQDFQNQKNQEAGQNIEVWNPGEKNYEWMQGMVTQSYLTEEEVESFKQEPDRIYLIKWKHLSYMEATWEKESILDCRQKIKEFKQFNRSLDKETRHLMIAQNTKHKNILDYDSGVRKKKLTTQQINEMRLQLYFLNQGKIPHEYTQRSQTIYKDKRLLRDYQLESLNWLIRAFHADRNVILADEMGLGKTIQTIAFLNHLYTFENYRGPFLIVAPLTTLQHWKRTVEDWTTLNGLLYYDQYGQQGRQICRQYEFFYVDISMKGVMLQASEIYKFQILITSYEVFQLDFQQVILEIPFQYVVIDEAHKLKNQNARILQALKRMPCHRTLLLTGTPIQNNTEELFSLLNFIEPGQFSNLNHFKREYGQLHTSEQVEKLNCLLKPYILRRQKEDVEQMIPPLQETIIDIEMTTIQKTIYKALYERNKSMLEAGFSTWAANAASLNNLEIQLRKCCNHPFLIQEMSNELTKGCDYLKYIEKLIESSGKMILLDKLLNKFRSEGRKILIFSQFTMMLQILEEYFKYKQVKYEKIDGQIKARERQNAIDRFNDISKNREVFLLSTKAGGQGINLTAAEVVIIYDSDWNPQNDVQATARAHRIGQSKEVTVYRLVTKDTYEAEMFERAIKKLGLDQAIFMGGQFMQGEKMKNDKKLSKQDMEVLLKNGIIGLINKNEHAEAYYEKNIEEILEKNSRTAKYSLINGSYTVSKSSFVSEKVDQNISIQDPNFWKIILKNAESKAQKLTKQFDSLMSLQEQKKYLEEVGDCVNQLIESKLNQSCYSADDEQIVSELLTSIANSNYAKNYRELAMNWIYELSKPSRRIKKISDMELGRKPQRVVEIQGEDARRLASKSKEELIKKLCYVCERPNCSVYCMGHCRRAFHEACKDLLETSEFINTDGPDPTFLRQAAFPELQWNEEQLKESINIRYACPDCRNNLVICLLCKKKGPFGGEKKQIEEGNEMLSKCSTANCNRYFHLSCIQGNPLAKMLDSNTTLFRCPSHVCVFCKINSSNMTTALIHCVRCCRSFHSKCANTDVKNKIQKIGKKVMICDQCAKLPPVEENGKINTIVKISIPKKVLKQGKLDFKYGGTTARTRRIEQMKYEQLEPGRSARRSQWSRSGSGESIKKKVQREKRRLDIHPYTYEELGIIPVKNFDYSLYKQDWCRYCGARFASNFTKGPWGSRTLCTIHYINWGQKKTLDLSEYALLPTEPINREDQTELQFLQRQKAKDPNFDPKKDLDIYNDEQYRLQDSQNNGIEPQLDSVDSIQ